MVLEECKRKVPYPIMVHKTDKDETDLIKAAKVADIFSQIHRPEQIEKRSPGGVISDAGSSHSQVAQIGQSQTLGKQNTLTCRYFKKEGHVVKDCPVVLSL